MSSTTTTTPNIHRPSHVTIIGGGLGGLTLARVLQKNGISTTIYEHDASPSSRPQGGTLDMHVESGQRALAVAGLLEKFEALCSREQDCMVIRDKDGSTVFDDAEFGPPPGAQEQDGPAGHEGGPDEDRPEIDRGILRQLLLDSLEPGTIKWGHTLRAIMPSSSDNKGRYQLTFEHTSTPGSPSKIEVINAEFVVGADGAWSRVRALLSPATPSYTGVSFLECELRDIDKSHPSVGKLIGAGSMYAISSNKAMIAQRNSGGRAKVYLGLRVPETWVKDCGIQFETNIDEARKGLLECFEGWSEELREFIRVCEPRFIPRNLMALETGFRWTSTEGITLIGDAAHVMSPFAGEGANLAMLDATELGLTLSGHLLDKDGNIGTTEIEVQKAVEQFETAMWTRAEIAADESARNLDLFMNENAPATAADMMRDMMSRGRPPQ